MDLKLIELKLKIVDLLARNNQKKFTINQISRQLAKPYSLVNRAVHSLTKENILSGSWLGHSKSLEINLKIEETLALILMNELVKRQDFLKRNEIRLLIAELESKAKEIYKGSLLSIVVFGSYAKGTENKESDIDILFIVKRKKNIGKILKEIYAQFEKNISIIQLTENDMKNKKNKPFMDEVLKSHLIMFGVNEFMKEVYCI